MNLWNKIVLYTKFLYSWESALNYLLGFLNDYLAKEGVAEKSKKVYDTVEWAVGWMDKLTKYCPDIWLNEYSAILMVLDELLLICKDHEITADEIKQISTTFAEAKAKWDED